MLKDGSDQSLDLVLDIVNDVLMLRGMPPSAWKQTKLIVIFKKGDPELPKNYQPIAILPILYKLFRRMFCNRLVDYVMRHQSVDQAAYRKGFSTENHLLTVTMLTERSYEYNFPVWLGMVDFAKAFDTVDHAALWEVLRKQGIRSHYISLLRRLYHDQTATVQADVRSRVFKIARGVKLGDPISALLFIAIMQDLCGQLVCKWGAANRRRKGVTFGIDFDDSRKTLTSLRFADDVILVARTRCDVRKMMNDFASRASAYGLKINFDKTKILTWDCLARGSTTVQVGTSDGQVVNEKEAEKYLGRKLCFKDGQETELENRIAAAWAAFHKHKGEMCSKYYKVVDRIRLFEAVVTATVLYGCSAWALTSRMCETLKIARRKMLRYVFRLHWRKCEGNAGDWVSYMRRSAKQVVELSEKVEMND